MAEKRRVVVVGARGVFGSLLAAELERDYDVVAGTRGDLDFRGAWAVACAAGPFQLLDKSMVYQAVEAGAHWLDIADDARWFFDLLDDPRLHALSCTRGVAVIPGLSSLPAISGALARRLGAPQRVEVTLFIGNANRKGAASMTSAAELNTPDRELFRRELGIDAHVGVELELPLARPILRLLGKLPRNARIRVAKLLARIPLRFGTSGGAVEVRGVVQASGLPSVAGTQSRPEACTTRVTGRDQRFAILPLVYALKHLDGKQGCLSPSVFDPDELLRFVER